MSRLWIDIERIVLDGVPSDPARAGRVATLTQMALERLLRERGAAAAQASQPRSDERATTRSPATPEERWADEIAHIVYRAVDRSL
jgi:hypothetical protein